MYKITPWFSHNSETKSGIIRWYIRWYIDFKIQDNLINPFMYKITICKIRENFQKFPGESPGLGRSTNHRWPWIWSMRSKAQVHWRATSLRLEFLRPRYPENNSIFHIFPLKVWRFLLENHPFLHKISVSMHQNFRREALFQKMKFVLFQKLVIFNFHLISDRRFSSFCLVVPLSTWPVKLHKNGWLCCRWPHRAKRGPVDQYQRPRGLIMKTNHQCLQELPSWKPPGN